MTIAASTLARFAALNPAAGASLNNFRQMVKASNWKTINDVRGAASKARVLNGERARFEIAGGDFRLIVAINFDRQIVFVKFIGTHAEYDRIDALTVSQF